MATTNGHLEGSALDESQSYFLNTAQQVTDIFVDLAKGYQKAAEGTVRLSFANLKALNSIVNSYKE